MNSTPLQQFQVFIERIRPIDPDHMLRIAALPAKKTPAEWWTNNVSRATYYWNAEHKRPWSRQWWLDWSGAQPALCDAKGQIKKSGWAEIFNYLSIYNRNGYGIYIQPNPCLLGDSGQSDALPGRCIFTESDGAMPANGAESTVITKALAEQAQALDPDAIVTTFKSAHTYRISESLYPSIGAWQVDQARFTQKAREVWGSDTDESLTDANQLMRSPGFNHARWQDDRMQFHPVQIAFDNGKVHAAIDEGLPALEAPIASKTEGAAHDFSAFELGSFAHLLEGFKENGRKGFDTCKCPAHSGESTNSLHINQTTSQFKCHAGCDSKDVYQAALKVAIAKGYKLPERTEKRCEHWDYDENYTGVWGQIAEQFSEAIVFKDDAPELIYLLPASLRNKIVNAKKISSPQAIALKEYALFLEKCGHPGYVGDAQELINGAWPWEGIPTRTPLWGWQGFIQSIQKFADKKTRLEIICCREAIQKSAADEKAAQIRALADAWEMIPEGVDWLDQQYFGDTLLERVVSAGNERKLLGVFGATGTGKTYGLKSVRRYAQQNERQFIYLTVKETLSRAAGRELELSYRLDLESAEEKQTYPDLAGCAASLIDNARGIDWENQVSSNAIVVLDEIDLFLSVAAGINAGGNCLELQRVLSRVLQKAQTVIILSAQLKSRHKELIERAGWFSDSEMIGILKAATPKKITICDDTAKPDADAELEGDDRDPLASSSLKDWLIDELANHLRDGKTALVLTGSQKPDSKLGTMLLEPFATQECGADDVLRLDSQSIKDPTNPAFKIADHDYVAAMRKAQLVVASPSCQEGFSLKFGEGASDSHFEKVFCFDPGSKLPEQIIQDVGRDRHDTETFISVAPGHTQKRFGGTTDPAEINRQLQAIANQKETELLNIAQFSNARNWDNEYLRFYCEDVAQANAAIADKVYNLNRYFDAVGHTTTIMKPTPGLSGAGIPEDFYQQIARERYHKPVAEAARIDKFIAEELQKKGEITLEQWYQIQQLKARQALRWDLTHVYNPTTDAIETSENPGDSRLKLDADFIRQWSRDRIAKPWQMHFYAQQNEWDWFAHDFKNTRFAPKFEHHKELEGDRTKITEDFTPNDILSLKSRRLSLLKELGILDFMNRWSVNVASDRITSSSSAKELTKAIHEEHREWRFTKRDLQPIVAKLETQFETVCELLGVRSQRNDDGNINHRQVLTIVRNVFCVKTFTLSDGRLNGDRGVYVLVADDKAQALRKGLMKADKADDDERMPFIIKARELYGETHNRIELHPVWEQHREIERKQFRDFLDEKSYKIELLDDRRPSHWVSLAGYIEQMRAAISKATAETTDKLGTEQEPLTDEGVLLWRLAYCQSAEVYEDTRRQLEQYNPDFDGHYWPQIPEATRQRIRSFYAVV